MKLTKFGAYIGVGSLLLIALIIYVLLRPTQMSTAPCTHWASANGTGSSCTQSSPCQINTFWQHAAPNTSLCLLAGTYKGSSNMIQVPETFLGRPDAPIVIRAETAGSVVIDGEDSRRPIHIRGQHGVLWGIDSTKGDNQNIYVGGRYWTLSNLITWNVGRDGDAAIHMSGTDNVIEDCAAFGPSRKPIAIGAAGGDRNIIRRCWTRWESNEHPTSNPSVSIEVGYGQNTATAENVISTWDTQGRVTEPEGILELFSTKSSKVLGSIFYVTANANFSPGKIVRAYTDAGSHAQQGDFNPTSNLVFKHVLAYIDPANIKFKDVTAFYFAESTTSGSPAGTGNVISNLVGVSGAPNVFSSRSFPASNVQWGASIAVAIGEGKSVWTDSMAAPGLCKRYKNGLLTEDTLWPWPMNARIKDRLVSAGYPAVDVTATMEQLFGPIPESCKTGGVTPVPPEPPIVPSAFSCAGDLLAGGKITMNCAPAGK